MSKNSNYNRPASSDATSVGNRTRAFWSTTLRKLMYDRLPTLEIMAEEETIYSVIRGRNGQDKAAWATIRARPHQIALLDIIRKRHLQNTGKELSRSEAMAALMVAGLDTILERDEFKRTT